MDLPGLADTALDRSIALGYGNVGLRVRRRRGRAGERRDVLVDNAGVMPDERERSADGVELWETCERLVHQDAAREHTAGHVDR